MILRALRNSSHHEWLVAGCLLALLALVASAVAGGLPAAELVPVRMSPLPGAGAAAVTADGQALRVEGNGRDTWAQLHFRLPPRADGDADATWMVWLERKPVDAVQLAGNGWDSEQRGFFHPHARAGPLPTGFFFHLPQDWQGDIDLQLRVRSELPVVLRPRVLEGIEAWRVERQGVAISATIYASLFTLALLALALFLAARDRLFLSLFGSATLTLLTLSAANGHLYQVDGLRWLATWGVEGLLALQFLLCASLPQLLLRYAGTRAAHPGIARAIDVGCIAMAVLAAVSLLDLQVLLRWLQPAALAARVACALACLWLVFDAARRRLPMGGPLAVLGALTVAAGVVRQLMLLGHIGNLPWLRAGDQIALAGAMAILAVGVINRIGDYRDQRDRDQLARLDSERRMQREAARSDLNATLQAQLRGSAEGDIAWTAFHLLLERLAPLVRADRALVVAQGYRGQDVLVVVPVAAKAGVEALVARRGLALKRQAANGIPLQQPVATGEAAGGVAMEALVPLPIRAPAWGMLQLERAGGEGFTTEEMALAGEFIRLALVHVDQALTAIQLRRSAELDALTGTFNRRTIDQWLGRSFGEVERDGQPISVLFVDMDHFKAINDKYGHACGDHCLRSVAQALRAALGEDDLLGRYGGEEFIAVLPGRGGAAARQLGEALRADVERLALDWEGQPLRLTVSVGVATRLHDERPAHTIDRADKALYAAKRGGRNRVHVAPAVFS
ncbi:GGDEF domain-containing protein [Luteimonas lutimaris]|uniref:diguanylate cyclase n=1 Tax=Luteimonas lutimaris TaxID=698645 RepID=A0ABP7M7H3_9GAMM